MPGAVQLRWLCVTFAVILICYEVERYQRNPLIQELSLATSAAEVDDSLDDSGQESLIEQPQGDDNATESNIYLICDSTGEYCVEPIEGEWKMWGDEKPRSFHAPTCCTWDKAIFNQLIDECGDHRWSDDESEKQNNKRYSGHKQNDWPVQIGGNACACKERFREEYVWTSPSLSVPFDSNYTCELLGTRNVLIVGDSTGQQFASTLMNALQPAGCAPQVHFSLSDTLLLEKRDRGFHWYEELLRVQPDIYIWGMGAHIWGQEHFRAVFEEIVANMTAFQQNQVNDNGNTSGFKTTFVYKTQQPAGCSDEISGLPPDEAALDMIQKNRTELYNHREYFDRDIYALAYLETVNMPVLDLRMLYSRGEAHSHPPRDCLHFCSPGPLDAVADLFQEFLELQKEESFHD